MEHGPCMQAGQWTHVFLAVMSVVQAIATTYLTTRAYRKNREDNHRQRQSLSDD